MLHKLGKLAYRDTGAVAGSRDYTTVVVVHGFGWSGGVFSRLAPHAAAHAARARQPPRLPRRGAVHGGRARGARGRRARRGRACRVVVRRGVAERAARERTPVDEPRPTILNRTPEEIQAHFVPEPASVGGSDLLLLHGGIESGANGATWREALYLHTSASDDDWADVEVRCLWWDRSVYEASGPCARSWRRQRRRGSARAASRWLA